MRWVLGVSIVAVIVAVGATMTVPAQTITPDEATLKLFPRETLGVAFVDVAALRAAPLFSELIMAKLRDEIRGDLKEFIEKTGFAIDRDVDRVTVGRVSEREFLIIADARFDNFKLQQFVEDHDVSSETYLGRVIYMPGDGDSEGNVNAVSFVDSYILLGSMNGVRQAIDRLAAPALSALQHEELMALIRTIESGNQVWAAGKFDLDMLGIRGDAPEQVTEIAHALETGTYQMRIDNDVFARATGSFSSSEMARATTDLARGFVAVAKLQVAQREELLRLLDGLRIENTGATMTVNFAVEGNLLRDLHQKETTGR